jgi:hypothetical protein
MKVSLMVVLCVACAAFACTKGSQTPTAPQTYSIPVLSSSSGDHAEAHALNTSRDLQNFRTHLNGDEEVPVRDTEAQGQATFKVSDDGKSISYKVNVANIENVTQSHIHLGAPGVAGGIVVWLYPPAPPLKLIPGRSDGTLGEGTITKASLVGSLAGKELSDLMNAIKAGNAYVNVHTLQFPPGEIRGQID